MNAKCKGKVSGSLTLYNSFRWVFVLLSAINNEDGPSLEHLLDEKLYVSQPHWMSW
jgi:hypothetical protein